VTRTVFGLLNALPIAAEVALKGETTVVPPQEGEVRPGSQVSTSPMPGPAKPALPARVELIRGIGPAVASLSDEVLAQIGKVSAIDDDMLRLMQSGRPPTPLLADTISRFTIDQDLGPAGTAELFDRRYAALQRSENEWVQLFQREYPNLPKNVIEQMLDRYGVDIQRSPQLSEARQAFAGLDSKARQYQQHVRLNRAYEGLFCARWSARTRKRWPCIRCRACPAGPGIFGSMLLNRPPLDACSTALVHWRRPTFDA
jgi:hypothetical protein